MTSTEAIHRVNLPQIKISYCVKCKWSLRAVWYLQEILQTYTNNPKYPEYHIPEISLIPSLTPGTFKVEVYKTLDELLGKSAPLLLWDRKRDDGFPDSKILKQKIRDSLFPGGELGHIDGHNRDNITATDEAPPPPPSSAAECIECNQLNE